MLLWHPADTRKYKTGFPITGLDKLDKDILVFHAGTKIGDKPGQVLTNGGRVLTVVALGKTIRRSQGKDLRQYFPDSISKAASTARI